jgi:hypothetical protein
MKLPRNILSKTVVDGVIFTVVKPRKIPKSTWISGKTSGSSSVGSSGFATGFPRQSTFFGSK